MVARKVASVLTTGRVAVLSWETSINRQFKLAIGGCSEMKVLKSLALSLFGFLLFFSLTTFGLAYMLIAHDLAVIFVTAYDEYALRAFEVHAVDYLLKPFSKERLAEALDRAKQRLRRKDAAVFSKLIAESRKPKSPLERILVRDGSKVHVIAAGKIDYLEAQDDYVSIKCGGKEFLKQETLSALEKSLDPQQFVRIHRSYILNLERLEKLELYTKDSRIAILADGSRLPVSRTGYSRLKPLL